MPEIRQNLTTVNFTPRGTNPSWIVVHNTANGTSKEGTAYANTNYFKSVNRNASANYFIDDGDVIWECVRPTDTAWHCGEASSRNGCTNYNSIGIEVCERADGTFSDKEIDNLATLIRWIKDWYGITDDHICRHHDVTGKNCPWYYSNDDRWNELKARITAAPQAQPQPEPEPAPAAESVIATLGGGVFDAKFAKAEPRHAEVQLYDANGTDAQRWKVKWDKNHKYFALVNVACGLALDVYAAAGENGSKVWTYAPNGSRAQLWRLAEIGGDYSPGFIRPVALIPQVNEGARLDVSGGNTENGTPICIWQCNDTPAQQWVIKDLGDGTWVLLNNIDQAKALDVFAGGKQY